MTNFIIAQYADYFIDSLITSAWAYERLPKLIICHSTNWQNTACQIRKRATTINSWHKGLFGLFRTYTWKNVFLYHYFLQCKNLHIFHKVITALWLQLHLPFRCFNKKLKGYGFVYTRCSTGVPNVCPQAICEWHSDSDAITTHA